MYSCPATTYTNKLTGLSFTAVKWGSDYISFDSVDLHDARVVCGVVNGDIKMDEKMGGGTSIADYYKPFTFSDPKERMIHMVAARLRTEDNQNPIEDLEGDVVVEETPLVEDEPEVEEEVPVNETITLADAPEEVVEEVTEEGESAESDSEEKSS